MVRISKNGWTVKASLKASAIAYVPPGTIRAQPKTGHSPLELTSTAAQVGDLVGQLGFLFGGGLVSYDGCDDAIPLGTAWTSQGLLFGQLKPQALMEETQNVLTQIR